MRNWVFTHRRFLTRTWIALTIVGGLLWLVGGNLEQLGIPIFFLGLIGFLLHDFVPLLFRTASFSRRIRQGVAPTQAREQVWRTHSREISAIGILYHRYLKFYPRWIHHRSDYYVPSMITEATAFSDHRVRIVMSAHEYLFSFTESAVSPDELSRGVLELFTHNEKVLGLHMAEEQSEVGPYWRVTALETYVEGAWRADFSQLIEKIAQDIEDRRRDARQT